MKKTLTIITTLLIGITRIYSQTVDASPETQTICGGGTANLTAVVTPGAGTPPTNSYTISSIAYTPDPYSGGTVVAGMGDDTQSPVMPIGFNFCFFGTTYSNFYVGSNGWVAFSPQPTTFTSVAIPSTGAGVPKNCIMGPWQDWYPGLSAGCVTYQVYGSAPFRRLVVSWNNCPMFSCTSTLGTFQITIYETTNVIENYIQLKPACLTWAGGTAVQGLHNAAGTVAFTVPGRNSTAWTAVNEGWRYTPNGTSLYQVNWYILPANTLIGTGLSITVAPPASPQYYYAQVVDLNACTGSGGAAGTNTDTVVVLSQTPPVDAGPYAQICPGTSATLNGTAATATSFSWSPAGSLSSSTTASTTATPGATTTYTLTVTDAMGCTGSDTVTVALANPVPTTSASPSIMCQGSSSSLTATGGGTYSWSPATGLSSTTIANPVATPSSDITYTVTVTGSGGCTATSSVSITVIPAPPIDAGTSVSICTGGSTVLNATGGNSYVWSPGTGLSSTTVANPTANPAATTTYTVVGTDLNGCTASDNVTVTVNPNPVVDAGANTMICPSASITLNGSGASTYSWTPAGSLSNPSIANPVASPTSNTTYTVTGTSSAGCTATDVVTISINPINVFTTGTATICSGASTTITAFGASNYVWSPAGTLSNATVSSPVATPASTTTYTVVGTNAAGCNDTAFVTITVTPPPSVDAGAAVAICAGSSTTLNATGATTYSWSPGTGLSSATVANPTASPASTTTYTVTGTQGGCTNTDVVTVTVNPLPTVDAGTSSSICAGGSTILSGSGATSYSWTPSSSLSSSSVSNPTASPASTTTYTVTGTGTGGCSATDTVTVFVGGMTVTASSSASTICAGSSATLNVVGGTSFSWSPSAGLSSTTVSNPVATPASTTTYTVVATSGACTNSATVTVTVTPLPSVNGGPTATICSGSSTVLGATGATSYVWSPTTGLSSSTIANPTASPSATTLYTVTGTQAGCSATDTVSVIVEALPVASAGSPASICGGASTTLSASGGVSYSWTPAATLSSSTIANPVATPASTTTYTVTVTGSTGCTATSTVTITVTPAPVANAGTDVTICNGSSTALSATGGGTYSWSPAGGLSSTTSPTPTATPASTTSYTVTVTSGTCTSTDVVTITVNSTMSMAPATTTDETCGDTDGTVTAGAITGGGTPYTYTISGGGPQSSPTFTGLSAGSYTVTVTDNAGCTASETVTVNSVLGVSASFSASPSGGTAPLTVDLTNTSNGASGYIWDFDNGSGSTLTNPSTVYGANGTYTIMLIAYNGTMACADTATMEINVFDAASMIVPNVFTPNGDGQNDVFRVIGTGLKTVEGTMYNRWGKKIADWSGDANAGWDGKINGKAAQDGTYFYVLKATGMDGKEYEANGYVQLLNN